MNIDANVGTLEAAGLSVPGAMLRAASEAESIVAVVKWFRPDKGYGFVDPGDGLGDGFLHAKVLRGCRGLEAVPPGATVRIVLEEGPRGRQVTRVLDVDASTSIAPVCPAPRERASQPRPTYDPASTTELTGKVKWFDEVRGFGFVAGDDFGRDVFVHCSIFSRTRVERLVGGQAVSMRVIESARGREAVEITV